MALASRQELESLTRTALCRAGMDDFGFAAIFDHLLHNERSGKKSHGFIRLEGFIKALRKQGAPARPPDLALDLPSLALVDGHGNLGMLAVSFGADVAIRKAKESGIAFVGIRNFIENTGTLNYYLTRIVQQNLVGIAGCNSVAMVCPPEGFRPVIGTNPIGFAVPAQNVPFVADLTTAQMPYGKMMVLKKQGKRLPPGVLVDADGNPSDDPDDAYKGALLPMSGWRGFSLGLAVELLSGPLLGQSAGPRPLGTGDGFFLLAIDPEKLNAGEALQGFAEEKLAQVRAAGHAEIMVPGERSWRAREDSADERIDVLDEVYKTMQTLAER